MFLCLAPSLLAATLHAQAPFTNFTRLHSFGFREQMGYASTAALIEGSDGALYGVAFEGGDSDFGTIFSLSVAPSVCCLAVTHEGMRFEFTGLPGRSYRIERASEIVGPW